MNWAREKFQLCGNRYRNHQKLVIYRHYVVYFINTTKHIEDIEPDIRKSMIADNFEADVVFVVDEWRFPAHKRILKISNEQFYVQHVEPHVKLVEIEVKGVDPRGFQQFLRFCHFGDLNLNVMNMLATYDVAVTYNHLRLAELCTNFICGNVHIDNILEIMNWNLSHQNYRIEKLCQGIFVENAMKILETSEKLLKIDKKLLKTILSWDVLNCSEKLLFNKTLEWAEGKCNENEIEPTIDNKKHILEDILHLIRLEISPNLEVSNDFPTTPRQNRFNKKRFDNMFVQKGTAQTWEEFPPRDNDRVCHGFSIILSNPENKSQAFEEFTMKIESEDELVLQKHFRIKSIEFLSIKHFVFETPIVLKKGKRHLLIVEFLHPTCSRYLGKDETSTGRILKLYD
jgi:hypothetical protein